MTEEILAKIGRIEDFAHGAYIATDNQAFNSIYSYLTQLKVLITAPDMKVLELDINELDLSCRTIHCLHGENIHKVGELVEWTRVNLLKTPNLGSKSMEEIRAALAYHGLKLKGEY